jgi:hypothetical protein
MDFEVEDTFSVLRAPVLYLRGGEYGGKWGGENWREGEATRFERRLLRGHCL